ncbi:MAG: hypothetical protein Q9217_003322 [Psora testacea]
MSEAKISEVVTVASYSWIEDSSTILVPGASEEAMLRAVQASDATFAFSEIDIVTGRTPMGKLYGVAAGGTSAFQFGILVVHGTVIFSCVEGRYNPPAGIFTGYREQFLRAYTKRQTKEKWGAAHHCVLRYTFGGLAFLVRTNVDAYLPQENSEAEDEGQETDELVALITQADNLVISEFDDAQPRVAVRKGGRYVPQTWFTEMLTRAKYLRTPFNIDQKMPAFWYGQTHNLVVASHEYVGYRWDKQRQGIFNDNDVKVHAITENVKEEWEQKNHEILKKLAVLIGKIVGELKSVGGMQILVFDGTELKIEEAPQGALPQLPADLMPLFERKQPLPELSVEEVL